MKVLALFSFFLLFTTSLFAQEKLLLDKEYTYKMDYKAFKKLYRKEDDRDKKEFIIYDGLKAYKKNMSGYYVAYKCKFNAQRKLIGFDIQFVADSKEDVRDISVSYMQELVNEHGYEQKKVGGTKVAYEKDIFSYKFQTLGYDYIDKRNKKWVAKYQMRAYDHN